MLWKSEKLGHQAAPFKPWSTRCGFLPSFSGFLPKSKVPQTCFLKTFGWGKINCGWVCLRMSANVLDWSPEARVFCQCYPVLDGVMWAPCNSEMSTDSWKELKSDILWWCWCVLVQSVRVGKYFTKVLYWITVLRYLFWTRVFPFYVAFTFNRLTLLVLLFFLYNQFCLLKWWLQTFQSFSVDEI